MFDSLCQQFGCVSEVPGADVVEKEIESKIEVGEELKQLLESVGDGGDLVGLVLQRDGEGVQPEGVAWQVQQDEHAGDDEQRPRDLHVRVSAAGGHARLLQGARAAV